MLLLVSQVETQPSPFVSSPQTRPNVIAPEVQSKAQVNEVDGVVVIAPLAKPEPDWSRKLNFDVRGVYKPSENPYLRQRPTNGCKVMAGGSVSPAGEYGVASGMVCVKPF